MLERLNFPPNTPVTFLPKDHVIYTRCYLCGSEKELTEEHVIPRIIFAPHDPGHYIKLSTCKTCNSTKGKEEEYIVSYLQATSFNPEARASFKRRIEGFKKGHGAGLKQDRLDRMHKFSFQAYEGTFLPFADAMKIDSERLKKFLIPIAKGLMVYHSLQHYCWEDYRIFLDFEQAIQSMTLVNEEPLRELLQKSRYGYYWRNVFFYKGDFTDDYKCSYWTMVLYGSHIATLIFERKRAKKKK